MNHVFLERSFRVPVTPTEAGALTHQVAYEAGQPRTQQECLLSVDGRRMLCRLDGRTPPLRSVRRPNIEAGRVWRGTIRHTNAPSPDAAAGALVDFVGERSFDAASPWTGVSALEHACRWCATVHRVHLIRIFESRDGLRVIGIFRAPDAESVRLAHRGAGWPLDDVWAYRSVSLESAHHPDDSVSRFARTELRQS